MNWLTPVCHEILAMKSFERDQRDTLVLWAAELSGICDQGAKDAPAPMVDSMNKIDMLLRWEDRIDDRELTVFVDPGLQVCLHLRYGFRTQVTPRPSHEHLKRAVRSFFEEP